MSIAQVGNIESILVTFMYLTSGYVALMLSYWITQDLDRFFEINGTDKIILTFIVGSFSVILTSYLPTVPTEVTLDNFRYFVNPIIGVTGANTLTLVLIRELSKKHTNKED